MPDKLNVQINARTLNDVNNELVECLNHFKWPQIWHSESDSYIRFGAIISNSDGVVLKQATGRKENQLLKLLTEISGLSEHRVTYSTIRVSKMIMQIYTMNLQIVVRVTSIALDHIQAVVYG